jgi:hypothetical protein
MEPRADLVYDCGSRTQEQIARDLCSQVETLVAVQSRAANTFGELVRVTTSVKVMVRRWVAYSTACRRCSF